ncbi:MAG: hypothetical protein AB7I18_03060 [Candidatus Berkiella sp.]
MATPLNPLRHKFQSVCLRCKQTWQTFQEKIQRLLSPLTHDEPEPWPALEEMGLEPIEEGKTVAVAHFPFDDKSSSIEQKNMVVVEVKYYPKNDTAEGEDLNLRITHYPPSNRLH